MASFSSSSSSSRRMLQDVEFHCSLCNTFMQSWEDVERHPHELTFRQKNISNNKSKTQCTICKKECQNSRNLEVHQKFKHPPLQFQDDTHSSSSKQQPTEMQQHYDDDEQLRQLQNTEQDDLNPEEVEQQEQYDSSINSSPLSQDEEDANDLNREQQQVEYQCHNCDTLFGTLSQLKIHQHHCHPNSISNIDELCENFNGTTCSINPEQCAFDNSYRSILIKPLCRCISLEQLILQVNEGVRHIISHCLKYGENIKVYATIRVLMHKINISTGEVEKEDYCHFSSKSQAIQSMEDITDFIDKVYNKVDANIDQFLKKGSNWVVADIEQMSIRIVRYNILRGGGRSSLKIPSWLLAKRAILNIDNLEDNECFKWAVIVSLHHRFINDTTKNRNRLHYYRQFEGLYDFSDIKFPATVEDIVKFQKANKSVAINALLYHPINKDNNDDVSKSIVPLYHPPHNIVLNREMAHILLFNNHWLPISNLNSLLRVSKKAAAYCYRCLGNYHKPNRLTRHLEKCYNTIGQKENMPKDTEKKFDDWSKLTSPPFVLYGDIEVLLIPPISKEVNDNEKKNSSILQIHQPCVVGSYLVPHSSLSSTFYNNKNSAGVQFHEGSTCIREFCQYLNDLVHIIYNFNKKYCNKPQDRNNKKDMEKFNRSTQCQYCKIKFKNDDPNMRKVWHHCHLSGQFIAALCQECNTKIRQPLAVLPVVFHNLKNYDMHSLCIDGFSKMKQWHLKPIALTTERYVTLSASVEIDRDPLTGRPVYFTLRFIDSYQFLAASLDSLVLSLDKNSMTHTKDRLNQRFPNVDDDILFKKGIFPYSYLDNEAKLQESSLPPMSDFFDTLYNSLCITDVEYAHAQRAFTQFSCRNLNDYLLRYLELDCLLLADVFENFRITSTRHTELDPVNFITLPQYSFAAAFKNCQVDLLKEVEMYQFFEQGIRGGMCFVNRHYTLADNETKFIAYWDENNLYANALRQSLPCSNFTWLTQLEIENINWIDINVDGEYGYTLSCDLHYPTNIHDETQDFPLAPEMDFVTSEMLTPFMQQQWQKRCEERGESTEKVFQTEKKLLMTCRDKKDYVVHFKLLQFYLKMGMIITKIHNVIRYRQFPIFREYIDVNSDLRKKATSTFNKDFYKLLNNSLFGKSMENVRGRKDFKLVNTKRDFEKLSSLPHFLRSHFFNSDLMLMEMTKFQVTLDKPIFIGQTVLDLSKLIMYDLRYNKLRLYETHFNGTINVLGGDTDSLICYIENINLHQDLHRKMLADTLLDTSNYPKDHPLFTEDFKATLGCVKDEVEGEKILEAVLLKPKAYSIKTTKTKTDKKTAKGIQNCVKKAIAHEEYVNVYEQQSEVSKTTRRFQSKDHIVSTIEQRKWALSIGDTKRAWIDVNYSLPFGHFRIKNDDGEPSNKRMRI